MEWVKAETARKNRKEKVTIKTYFAATQLVRLFLCENKYFFVCKTFFTFSAILKLSLEYINLV